MNWGITVKAFELMDTITDFVWDGGPDDQTWSVCPNEDKPGEAWLQMTALVRDNFNPAADRFRLTFQIPVDADKPALDQIRSLIHWYLQHEADETIWYKGERVFNPHRERT